jgi:hypothetical protein
VGQAEGAELDEDELLGRLREKELITYPSSLLSFLEEYPDLFKDEVLPRLDSTDIAVFAQVGPPLLAAVVASGLPCVGKSAGVPLVLQEFCGSVGRLAWACLNWCPWESRTCRLVAGAGHLGVLQWAREQDSPCQWDRRTCESAAEGGHLEVLKWAWEHGCPGGMMTCASAAKGGHLDVLRWAREQDPPCPWDECTCRSAAENGHLEVLRWAREQDPACPWQGWIICGLAARGGHLEVLRWAREQDCEWDELTCAHAAEGGHLGRGSTGARGRRTSGTRTGTVAGSPL